MTALRIDRSPFAPTSATTGAAIPAAVALAALAAFAVLAGLFGAGCADRREVPAALADSTRVYEARRPGGPAATITFCRKFGSKTDKPIGEGLVFTMGEKEHVRARVEFENLPDDPPMDLMFHLVWLNPDGYEFYTKRIDMAPGEVESAITTAISIPPGRRDPGRYSLLVYLYRELIAEKSFTLLEDGDPAGDVGLLIPDPPGIFEFL